MKKIKYNVDEDYTYVKFELFDDGMLTTIKLLSPTNCDNIMTTP